VKTLDFSPDLKLPIDAATQTFAFIGRKGSGKTYAAGKLVEELIDAKVQCVILDTVGNWYGLRLSADGKKPSGLEIPLLGGLRGDIPLKPEAGHMVADLVTDTGRSIVLDLSQFSFEGRRQFATAFGRQLWQRKKGEAHPTPLHLIIEECQLIVPEHAPKGGEMMLHVYEEIIRLGRNYGIGASMISQRPQSVSKEVLNQAEPLLAFQLVGAHERKAVREWVTHMGLDINLVDELPSLSPGYCWFWSPQWLTVLKKVHVGKKRTLDASATPKVGDRRVRSNPRPIDLKGFQDRMTAVIEEAKASDPKLLRQRVLELTRELQAREAERGKKPAAAAAVEKVKEKRTLVRVPAIKPAEFRRIEKITSRLADAVITAKEISENAGGALEAIAAAIRSTHAPAPTPPGRIPIKTFSAAKHLPIPRNDREDRAFITRPIYKREPPRRQIVGAGDVGQTNGNGSPLPSGERLVLRAIAQFDQGAEKNQLAVLTGYKTRTRNDYIKRLRDRGLIEHQGHLLVATEAGVAELGPDFERLPVGSALQEHWRGRLPAGELKILEILVGRHPDAVPREELDEPSGFAVRTRNDYLSRLIARRLVTNEAGGMVRASDNLFD
jgi:hypothetical protein